MLKSYEAIYENGQVKWLEEVPQIDNARIIITVLEETKPTKKRHFPLPNLAGKVKILGDIVSPIVDDEDWECLK
jgi:predicted DNA-binding antitoxin AbrB/MazE fold protein